MHNQSAGRRWAAYGITWALFLTTATVILGGLSFLMER